MNQRGKNIFATLKKKKIFLKSIGSVLTKPSTNQKDFRPKEDNAQIMKNIS